MADKFRPGDVVKITGVHYVILGKALVPSIESHQKGLGSLVESKGELYRVVRIVGTEETISLENYNEDD